MNKFSYEFGFFLSSTNGLSETWFEFYFSLALITDLTLLKVLQGKLPSGSGDV